MRQMYKPENIEIGGRIRSAREALGMTRDEFAEAVGISSQFASDLERGRMGASVETICRICQVLVLRQISFFWADSWSQGSQPGRWSLCSGRWPPVIIPICWRSCGRRSS